MRRASLLGLLCASACWVPVERGRQMEARIERLEGESEISAKQLDEQRAVVRERVAAADAKIAEVQRKLDELNATAHRSGADLAVNQDRLGEEVRRLNGTLEELSHRLRRAEGRRRARRVRGAPQDGRSEAPHEPG